MPWIYTTPQGEYSSLYADMLQQDHLLIAGATGSGKSVVINGLVYTALYHSPAMVQFILIDLKCVELIDFKGLPHVLKYASEQADAINALTQAIDETRRRYKLMQRARIKKYDGGDIYVIIDELADLMTTSRRQVQPLIQRLCQIGRAAKVHVIAATQSPIVKVIPTEIKVNFDSRLGLRTSCTQDSRNILGISGCECLPNPKTAHRAQGYYKHDCELELYELPMIAPDNLQRQIDYWKHNKPRWTWA